MRNRGAAIIMNDNKVALIKRSFQGEIYYVFPGGGIEKGETPEETAIREALEELGVQIHIQELFLKLDHMGIQYYYLSEIISGEFGTGTGIELNSKERGTYEPVWIALDALSNYDIRPVQVSKKLIKDFSK